MQAARFFFDVESSWRKSTTSLHRIAHDCRDTAHILPAGFSFGPIQGVKFEGYFQEAWHPGEQVEQELSHMSGWKLHLWFQDTHQKKVHNENSTGCVKRINLKGGWFQVGGWV